MGNLWVPISLEVAIHKNLQPETVWLDDEPFVPRSLCQVPPNPSECARSTENVEPGLVNFSEKLSFPTACLQQAVVMRRGAGTPGEHLAGGRRRCFCNDFVTAQAQVLKD
jgi:hypothetical protein